MALLFLLIKLQMTTCAHFVMFTGFLAYHPRNQI